ncbi:MAG: substrate-binding domain-containing protein [Kiritimatiellae bacterium]|nr:substrate-binding domain-containing protein [Kiritimatiellia bacterium]
METVLVFQHVDTYASRLRLEGLNAFAKEAGWTIQTYDSTVTPEEFKGIMEFWSPLGVMLCPNDGASEFDASNCDPGNTVLLDCFAPNGLERFASVITDSYEVSELAARELLGAKCASYGFVPWPVTKTWSENRRQNFSRILSKRGLKVSEFKPSKEGLDISDFQRELMPWLKSLPKPCGILAANDRVGAGVINVCRLANFMVPFDCAVVGVDDYSEVCEGCNPALSSVALDFRRSGFRAGEMLDGLVRGRLDDRPLESIPPLGFVRRNSSRVFLRTDSHALRASEFIRAKALGPLHPHDVLALFPCSRRLAEIRFREATGRSIGDEIRAVRIAHAKKLLENPYQRLDAVAAECGYESDTTFRRVFKEETGCTLRDWQRHIRT